METIFDHNPTEEEMKRFQGLKDPRIRAIWFNGHTDNHYCGLGILFSMREDKERADECRGKIERKSMLDTLIRVF